MKQQHRLTDEQERQRLEGLRILARLIARHYQAHPDLYPDATPGMTREGESSPEGKQSRAGKEGTA